MGTRIPHFDDQQTIHNKLFIQYKSFKIKFIDTLIVLVYIF